MLGDNRQLSRNELQKLALYCEGQSTVTSADITLIIGDGSSLVLNDVVDATATGNTSKLQSILPKAIEAGTSPDMVLSAVLRHFQLLQHLRSKMETSRQPATSLVSAARPPIHFSRRNTVSSALSVWPVSRLSKALIRLDSMMLECRKNASAAKSITGTTLLALALEAQALARR